MRVRWYITLPILIDTEIRCNALPPANGGISATSVLYGEHTAYSCDDGYYLIDKAGDAFLISTVTCLETGEFSNVLSCQGLLSLIKDTFSCSPINMKFGPHKICSISILKPTDRVDCTVKVMWAELRKS